MALERGTKHEEMGKLAIEEAQLGRRLKLERITSAKLKGEIERVRRSRMRKDREKKWRVQESTIEELEHRRSQIRQIIYPIYEGKYTELRGRRDHETFFNVNFSPLIADTYAGRIEQAQALGKTKPTEPVDVCDLSLGQGHFLFELKKEFPNIVTHGVSKRLPKMKKFHPDFPHIQDVLDPKSNFQKSQQRYDLIVSRRGPPFGTEFKYHKAIVLDKLKPLGQAFIEINKTRRLRRGNLVEEYDWMAVRRLALHINQSFKTSQGPNYAADLYQASEIGKKGEILLVPTLRIVRLR